MQKLSYKYIYGIVCFEMFFLGQQETFHWTLKFFNDISISESA